MTAVDVTVNVGHILVVVTGALLLAAVFVGAGERLELSARPLVRQGRRENERGGVRDLPLGSGGGGGGC